MSHASNQPSSPAPLVTDHTINPLIYVPKHTYGYLAQPGSTTLPQSLTSGWQWHWPLLTTIRIVSLEPYVYAFSPSAAIQQSWGDEAIVAVTKDHTLVKIQGHATICVNQPISLQSVSLLDKHTLNRIVRPLIRQSVRQVISTIPHHQLHASPAFNRLCQSEIQQAFKAYDLDISQTKITSITQFHPFIPTSPEA